MRRTLVFFGLSVMLVTAADASDNRETSGADKNFNWLVKVDPIHLFFRGIGGKVYLSPPGSNIALFGSITIIPSSMGFSGPFSIVDGLIYYIPLNFIVARSSTFYELQGEMLPLSNGFALEGGILLGSIDKFIGRKISTEIFVRFVKGNEGEIYDIYAGYPFSGGIAISNSSLQEIGARLTMPILRTNPKYSYVIGLDGNIGGAIGLLRWERYYYSPNNDWIVEHVFLFDVLLNFNLFVSF